MKFCKSGFFNLLREIAYVNILTIQMTFFAFNSILGLKYQGAENNVFYIVILILSSILSYIFIFSDLLRLRKFSGYSVLLLFFPLLIIISFLLAQQFNPVTILSLQFFFIFSLPSLYIGYIVALDGEITLLKRGFVIVSYIVLLSILTIIRDMLSASYEDFNFIFGGASYQTLSYTSAFCYSVILFQHFYAKRTKSSLSNILNISFLLIFFSAVILSGGRGGAVIVIFSTFYFILSRDGLKSVILFSLFFGTIFFFLLSNSIFFEIFMNRGARVFSYISGSGIDLNETSGRDELWNYIMPFVYDSPVFGYGIFSYTAWLGPLYPHNFFLEILIQGGIVYLFFWLFLLTVFFLKLRNVLKQFFANIVVLSTVVTSFTFLLFSGTYLQNGLFWFSLTIVIFSNLRTNSKLSK